MYADYHKFNGKTKYDPFPLSFIKEIIKMLASHEMLTLLDGFYIYNQVRVALGGQPKTCFLTKWGIYATKVMSLNAPSTFQRGIMTIFAKYLNDFIKVFLDNLSVYGQRQSHQST